MTGKRTETSASAPRRAAATAINVLLALLPLIVFLPFFVSMTGQSQQSALIANTIMIAAIPFPFLIYYFMVFVGAWSGKESPGRRLLGLVTVYSGGKALFVRYILLGILPLLLVYTLAWMPLLLLPLLLPLLRPDLCSPLDKLAGVTVCPKN